jgi:hypothetical protein
MNNDDEDHHSLPQNSSDYCSDPHLQHTRNCQDILEKAGNIADHVVEVIKFMDSLHLNLLIFLWAISWNVPELVANPKVKFVRTTLMTSEELPDIITCWHTPPHAHNSGVHTHAARESLDQYAVGVISDAIDVELRGLKLLITLSPMDMTEQELLGISWKGLRVISQESGCSIN